MTIVELINKNEDKNIDWVFEFFNGKYTREEVKYYLYNQNPNEPRAGVLKLAEEFRQLNSSDTAVIRDWYINTDFYIFDLLPWNGSGQFEAKLQGLKNLINEHNFKSIIDFGGGLGVASIWLKQECGIEVTYVDLPNSVTSRFAKFLFDKVGVDIPIMSDTEFFESNLQADLISAMDCFEHIPNMEEVFDKLTDHSYVIVHDSTFFSDQWSPQHVYTPTQTQFINMALLRNYVPYGSSGLLWRAYLTLDQNSIAIKFINK